MVLKRINKLLIIIYFTISPLAFSQTPEDAAGWFSAAQEAREAGALDQAFDALEKASTGGFAAARISFERARLLTLSGKTDAAIAELQALADNGFNAVAFITGDPIINTLEGEPAYDDLVATMSIKAYPCEHDDAFGAFDFWLGEWVVYGPTGIPAGTNSVQREERGCVIVENWTSVSGITGMSVNYLDKATGEWVQVWNSANGSQINIRGGMTDEGMLLVGQIHDVASNTTTPFRGLWTQLDDGRVRQYFEQSADDGKTWSPWFEGFYTRQE